jgi:hypothetical protein
MDIRSDAATGAAPADRPRGSIQIRAHKGRPFCEARWRDRERVDRRKRLGPAWVEPDLAVRTERLTRVDGRAREEPRPDRP